MKLIRTLISRYGFPAFIFTACLALWFVSSSLLQDYQASVGPDFLGRLPVKVMFIPVIAVCARFLVKFAFPSIYKFTDTEGGHKESNFSASWRDNPTDPRLWQCVLTYLVVYLILTQVFLAS